MKSVILAVAAAAILAAPAAADDGWRLLGEKTVNDATDRDVISLPGPMRYSRVRICVERAPVRFYDVSVEFGNGGKQDVSVAALIPDGACTRAIDLKGGARDITRINFLYEAKSLGLKRATVRAYGR